MTPHVLNVHEALGRYGLPNGSTTLEFQIDRTLVWVNFHSGVNESEALRRGNDILLNAWNEIPYAIELAEKYSRKIIPQFWKNQDNTIAVGQRLAVWGIRLRITDGQIEYDVSRNHDFFDSVDKTYSALDVYEEEPIQLQDFPDRHHIYITRCANGIWSERLGN